MNVQANVPANAFYKAWHMPGRFHKDYYAVDLLSDLLGRGQSSRLYQKLVKEKEIFTSISSFLMGTIDPGLMVISGRVNGGVELESAEQEVDKVINELRDNHLSDEELNKVKNQAESILEFGEVEVINRAMNLAFAKLSGDANLVNTEARSIDQVTTDDIKRVSNEILHESNSNALYYHSIKK
jgi:zinc protease